MSDNTIILAALGIVASCVAGLIWVIKYMFSRIVPALEGLTNSTVANTVATKRADDYLRDRNGRDNTMHKELIKAVGDISQQIIDTADVTAKTLVDHPIAQKVETQVVQTQVVKKTD